jgi:hypothetical protein
VTDLDLIRNCVMQIRRPFDAARIAGLTGADIEVIEEILPILERDGVIKRISGTEAIWVRANRYRQTEESADSLPWAVYPEKAVPLLDLLARQPFSNGRKMAKALGMSHQWVYVYLKALVSAGVVRKTRGRYVVVKQGSLRLLGVGYRRRVLRAKTSLRAHCRQQKRRGAVRRN